MKTIKEVLDNIWDSSVKADIPSKFPDLNRYMNGGFTLGHITVVAGRTAMGKTAFGFDTLLHSGMEGFGGAGFSLEMSLRDIGNRLLRNYSGGEDRPSHLKDEVSSLPILLDDSAGVTPSYIRESLEGLPTLPRQIVIDYLQLMRPDSGVYSNRNDEINSIMQDLLGIAKEFNIHILLLSQLNRAPDGRFHTGSDGRPSLSDLRDSGTIENTAHEVILLYRPDYYEEFDSGTGQTELILAKNREGPRATVNVTFHPEEYRFE